MLSFRLQFLCHVFKPSITYRVEANSRWQIPCSGPDFTRIIYAVLKFHSVIRTWSCVRGGCACREAWRLARISFHVRRVPKWHLKGTGKLFSEFLCCVEVSHNIDLLALIATFDFTFKVGVLDITAHVFRSSSSSSS